MVALPNFSVDEAKCSCGCGKDADDRLMLRLQVFIFTLIEIWGCPVRCLITGPARCEENQRRIYGTNEGEPTPESYHLGPSRVDDGRPGVALDVVIQKLIGGAWLSVQKEHVANLASKSKLFGGIGWKSYGPEKSFVHLDLGPKREW